MAKSGQPGIKPIQLNKASAIENDSSNDIKINIDINVRERSNRSAARLCSRWLPRGELLFAVWGWGSGQAHQVALQLHRDHTSKSLRLYHGAPAPADELQGPGHWEARVGTAPNTRGRGSPPPTGGGFGCTPPILDPQSFLCLSCGATTTLASTEAAAIAFLCYSYPTTPKCIILPALCCLSTPLHRGGLNPCF